MFIGRKRSGRRLLADLAVIAELKVASTQGQGLDHSEVVHDFWKLSMLLTEADGHGLAPAACVCVLDNHPTRIYSRNGLHKPLADDPIDQRVALLLASHRSAPQTT